MVSLPSAELHKYDKEGLEQNEHLNVIPELAMLDTIPKAFSQAGISK